MEFLRWKLPKASNDRILARADVARDARQWLDAARFYAEYLQRAPNVAGIHVQLGHALKESGKVGLALDSYLRANELEGLNSDTAIQIGHAMKLLGRREEAEAWYTKALVWPNPRADGLAELRGLGVDRSRLEVLIRAAGRSVRERNARRPINVSLASLAHAPAALAFLEKLKGDIPKRRRLFQLNDEGQAAVLRFPGVGSNHAGEVAGKPIEISYVPHCLSDTSCLADPAAYLHRIDAALATSELIVTNTERDAIRLRARAMTSGTDVEVVALNLRRHRQAQSTPSPSADGPDIVVLPRGRGFTQAVTTIHRDVRGSRELIFVTPGSDLIAGARCVDEKEGVRILPNAASVVIANGQEDQEFWAALAIDAGVPVIAERSGRLHGLFRGLIGHYIDLPAGLTAAWADLHRRPVPGDSMRERWADAWVELVERIQGGHIEPRAARSEFGQFSGFTHGDAGLFLRVGENWTAPEAHGSPVGAGTYRLVVRGLPPSIGQLRVTLLLASASADQSRWLLQASCGPSQGQAEVSVPKEGWGWVDVSCNRDGFEHDRLDLSIHATTRELPATDEVLGYLSGLVIYPESEDRYWFEFLDKVSRGGVPTLRAVRRWAKLNAVNTDRLRDMGPVTPSII